MNMLFTAILAHAHGPPLAPIGVAFWDRDDVADIVRLTEGLAQRTEDGEWRFLCPALWSGLPDAPLMSSASDGALVHGLDDAYLLLSDGTSRAAEQEGFGALRLIDTARRGQQTLALVREDAGDALWSIEPAHRLADIPGRGTSLALHKDHLLVTTMDSKGGLILLTLSPLDGKERARWSWPTEGAAIPEVRSDGEVAWVVLTTEDQLRIEAWAGEPGQDSADAQERIAGPIRDGTTVLIGLDDSLHRLDADGWQPIDQATPVQCLARHQQQRLACVNNTLVEIDTTGQSIRTLLDLNDLQPPELTKMPKELASDCEVEWYRALSDLGRTPAEPTKDTGVPPSVNTSEDACGCQTTGGRGAVPWLPLLWLIARRHSS